MGMNMLRKRSCCFLLIIIFVLSVLNTNFTVVNGEECTLTSIEFKDKSGTVEIKTSNNGKVANVDVTDLINGVIKINGNIAPGLAGRIVNILALNPNGNLSNAETNSDMLQYQGSAVTDGNGYFEKTFQLMLNSDFVDGDFKIYIGGDGFDTPEEHTLYFVSINKKIEIAKDICNKDISKENLVSMISNNKKALAIDTNTLSSIDLVPFVERLKLSLLNTPISFQNEEEGLLALQLRIKQYAVIECFNQGINEAVYNNDGAFIDDNLISMTQTLSNSTTLINHYNNDITDAGKVSIREGLMKQSCNNLSELYKLYAKQIILNGIKNNKLEGYGFISDYLTEINSKYAGLAIPKYLELSSKRNANSLISKNADILTIDNLGSKIEEYALDDSSEASSTKGTSSKGSGSFSAPVSSTIPIDESKNANNIFADIGEVKWASDAINGLYDLGIINGTKEGIFSPNQYLTREQLVKIICLAFKLQLSDEVPEFEDVSSNSWYVKYVSAAKRAGIVSGVSDKLFGAGENITRQDLAVMIYRAISPQKLNTSSNFTDNEKISKYAIDAVNYLKQIGILDGYEDGSFRPENYLTRAETAKVIYAVIMRGNN